MTQNTSQVIEIQPKTIDARGPRFSAAITTVVLATALATHSVWVLIAQALVFAIGAFSVDRSSLHTLQSSVR